MAHEMAAALTVFFGLFAGLRPALRWLFGHPIISPLVCILVAGLFGSLVLFGLYGWRRLDGDRSDYLQLALRKWRTGGRGAYNPLDRPWSTSTRC